MVVQMMFQEDFEARKLTNFGVLCRHNSCVSYVDGMFIVHCDHNTLHGDGTCAQGTRLRLNLAYTTELHKRVSANDADMARFGCSSCNEERGVRDYAVDLKYANGKVVASCKICGDAIITVLLAKKTEVN